MTELYQRIKQNKLIIAGPCVMESFEIMDRVGEYLKKMSEGSSFPIVFKASFDKANRTSINSFRGPGLEVGLKWLSEIKSKYGLYITTDIHEAWQVSQVGECVDIIQIPAFLCRQTDLLLESGKTGKIVNIKKAQFLTAEDMKYPVEKVLSTGNSNILLTERGNILGYNNLIVDFRNIPVMQQFGFPVIMDCTHAVQQLGKGSITGGNRSFVKPIALAAKAFGVNGYFFEVHPDPDTGLSDAANMYPLEKFSDLVTELIL